MTIAALRAGSENLPSVTRRPRAQSADGHGDLVAWAQDVRDDFWHPVTETTLERASVLAEWATDPARRYTQAAVDDFLSKADFWLVAEGMASQATVVTREIQAPESRKSIKIPDACAAFGVTCAQPFEVYTQLGLRLT